MILVLDFKLFQIYPHLSSPSIKLSVFILVLIAKVVTLECLISALISPIIIRNNKVPRTASAGTSLLTVDSLKLSPLIIILCLRFVRSLCIHISTFPLISRSFNSRSRIPWSTSPKSFAKSKYITSTSSFSVRS